MNTPVLGKERVVTIDVLRGFAIFGIFLVNLSAMTGLDPDLIHAYTGLDKTIRFLLDLFVQTKFYAIFSFLFGLGFYIFMSRAEARGNPHVQLFSRRLLILFGFGMLHYILFWDGDILHSYALIGFFLLFFYRAKPITLLVWGIILFGFYHLVLSLTIVIPDTFLMESFEPAPTEANYFTHFLAATKARGITFFTENFFAQIVLLPEVLSLFLFGLLAGKIHFFQKINLYKHQLIRALIISISLFILFSIPTVYTFLTNETYYSFKQIFWTTIGGKALAVFYIAAICLLMQTQFGRNVLRPFKYVGQTALTNYLLQTLIGVVGISVIVKNTMTLPLSLLIIIAIIVFCLQILFSKKWLKTFQFGPIEWIWRMAIYQKIMPLRKKQIETHQVE